MAEGKKNRTPPDPDRPPLEKKCLRCGNTFYTHRSHAKTCGPTCRVAYHRASKHATAGDPPAKSGAKQRQYSKGAKTGQKPLNKTKKGGKA